MVKAVNSIKQFDTKMTHELETKNDSNLDTADEDGIDEYEHDMMQLDTTDSTGMEQTGAPSDNDSNSDDELDEDDISMAALSDNDESVKLYRLPCLAHTLQLVLKEVDKNYAFHSVVIKARQLVRSISVSSVATES